MVTSGLGYGRPQVVVKETGSASGSLTSESMKETDLGTSVDDLMELQASLETLEMSETGNVGQEPVLKLAGPSPNMSISSKAFDIKTEAPLASQDSLCSLGQEKAHIAETVKESEVKVDKLAALSAQIDDFDPSELFGKKDVEKVGADNEGFKDGDLIDSLIQDLEVEESEVRELNDDDYDYGNHDEEEIDETENVEYGVKTDNANGKCVTDDSLSKKDENEHSDGKVNGSMSNSTESDGFNEEAVNGSATLEKSETKAPEGIEIKAKTAAVKVDVQKSESGQPTKLKSKKKEDKGIGEFHNLFIKIL
ncbi:hypothetical protein DPMN_013339 [Dreissena polymorpha]|uniref:Uncharacterized protein n=1 Tax=Dreissena polymorpha TaxID=45954 RepID=A0A9D4N7L3_DREPO|nr:hypothetical protein DPMN_013339 [Dreissena polymorpha]